MMESRPMIWPDVRVVFVQTYGIFAAITRWVTRSPANHMYVEIPVWGRRMVCEATTDGGVRLVPSTQAGTRVLVAYRCHFDTSPGLYAVAGMLGRPYDYWGGFLIAVMRLARRWFQVKRQRWSWSTRAIKCSELAVMFFQACQIQTNGLSVELAAPSDVLAWCNTRPGWFELIQGTQHNLAGWKERS
jgi:hypothetical protein